MNINQLIFPGFWFGKSKIEDAVELARRGVGGFAFMEERARAYKN